MQNGATIFSPVTFGKLELPNRIVMAPMTRSFSPNNIPSQEMLEYYKRRAEGGTGLIITEGTFINHPVANGYENVPAFYADALPMWKKIVDTVHESGAKIMPQLWHTGNMRTPGVSPNPQMLNIGPMDEFDGEKQLTRAMKQHDIDEVIKAFTQAAIDAVRMGFDGVEIHGAHGYLIDQFLWRKSNRRTDKYGGSLDNRIRLASEIVRSIRNAVPSDFTIVFRFSQWKIDDYNAKIAENPDELESILLALSQAGVDIFHASERDFAAPAFENANLSLATWTKLITEKPVITVGGIGIDKILDLHEAEDGDMQTKPKSLSRVEEKLKNREFDLIGVGRALLADPNWANKMKNNQMDAIIPFSTSSLKTLS